MILALVKGDWFWILFAMLLLGGGGWCATHPTSRGWMWGGAIVIAPVALVGWSVFGSPFS